MQRSPLPDGPLAAFRHHLRAGGFAGDLAEDGATRAVFATDNSVYELPPLAVVFPRTPEDLNRIARAATASGIAITARGGGTGTNGQSLTDAVVVDCSRHLTVIEEINTEEGYAIVQPGVVLDQLNRALAGSGLFFAPTVSTASRATLGGMAATDASGKGSRLHGRTSDHVLGMELALADGSDLTLEAGPSGAKGARAAALSALIRETAEAEAAEIARVFPVMNRGLTGYNLQQACQNGTVSLIKLLCGSEGTLALTKRLRLRLVPKPQRRALIVYAYDDMTAALHDVGRLLAGDPAAIEFIDDKILTLAQQDPVWGAVAGVLEHDGSRPVRGLNFVEVTGAHDAAIRTAVARFSALAPAPASLINARAVTDDATIGELWSLRAKCVGLLGRMDPTRQGTPFVEDAAVPAENLPAFVAGFRAILDAHGLSYGMFGHADVGCVHVRPALDMRLPDDAAMIRDISDAVHRLARDHGGLIWGEHGKGFRGEYVPDVFGPRLYTALCRIKAAFDPDNLLNPGKIASPDPAQKLTPLDAVPFRGPLDARITPALSQTYAAAIKCNGNGQCMGRDPDEAMCPSYKATGDRLRGPKGRAALLRSWARQQSAAAAGAETPGLRALEAELHDSLSDCLGCRACAAQCPVRVDVPQMRSRFYASYFSRHRRPLSHHLLARMEDLAPLMRAVPAFSNAALRLLAPVLRATGLTDLPQVRPAPRHRRGHPGTRGKVMLIADGFLGTFDGAVIAACADLLGHLGYEVTCSTPVKTGKALHMLGLRRAFSRRAAASLAQMREWQGQGYRLVAVEPAFVSMFTAEYAEEGTPLPEVTAIDRFLLEATDPAVDPAAIWRADRPAAADARPYSLFSHCTEAAADPQTPARWAAVFARFGLAVQSERSGCCGMAGTFGHMRDKAALSERLYDLSWRGRIEIAGERALATGFSCRCQAKRFSGRRPLHPVEVLSAALRRR
ncbi:FAD-binding and (Fe-S)-binding domain-containing protein [Phaeovulum sp. W22_SRMD_FR3]|uniref:FAD-binding and (Fe-S)-binding domain-containing protein n=1 Tax=Phaeovulum sp. W22_SRMD_FR3 TaxID=3240274 RepID=UPI003F97B606